MSLLNVGSEEIKGTEILKTASKRLRDLSNDDNFIYKGYIEGNNIMSGINDYYGRFYWKRSFKNQKAQRSLLLKFKKSLTETLLSKLSYSFIFFFEKFRNKLDLNIMITISLGLNGP